MSKREFTVEDFFGIMGEDHRVHPTRAAERANAFLPEILAPYVDDLRAAREALEYLTGVGIAVASEALAAQKVKL